MHYIKQVKNIYIHNTVINMLFEKPSAVVLEKQTRVKQMPNSTNSGRR